MATALAFLLLTAAAVCVGGESLPASSKLSALATSTGRVLQRDGGGGSVEEDGDGKDSEEGISASDPICPPCECSVRPASAAPPNKQAVTRLRIVALEDKNIYSIVEDAARNFEAHKKNAVKIHIDKSPDMPAMYNDIISDAKHGGGMYDGYFSNPTILGSVSPLKGFLDLKPYIRDDPDIDWTDILLPFRTFIAGFEDKTYMLPLDGDTHAMYVRKDILEHFGQKVPRTWDEYNAVAKAVHGKEYNNITLNGSCISRVIYSHAQYYTHLVLASMTQTNGQSTGSMFDTDDMKPLTGQAMVEMLRILEEQMAYGVPDEFDDLNLLQVQSYHINDGTCAMTYGWGGTYKVHRANGSVVGPGQLGVYPTPGSTKVLDRKTMQLVPCTKERCKYGKYYEDIGWVNFAPYLANGGWSGAVSANAEKEKQDLAAEFFMFACSKEEALKGVIPNATEPMGNYHSQSPFRKTQMEVDKWVNQGYDAVSAKEYQITVLENTLSKNLAVDMRTPEATEIMGVLDEEVYDHLIKLREGKIPDDNKEKARQQVMRHITDKWVDIIKTYDRRDDTEIPFLQIYQRLRGVYVANEEKNQLTTIRPVGLTLMTIVFTFSIFCAFWTFKHRTHPIIKGSQPCFLSLICIGTLVMSSSIVPMSIDDGIASDRGASIACMATPWLVATGFAMTFSALFSKIWRLNILYKSARRFRRVQVSVKDVLKPLIVLMVLNIIFLTVWTVVDPRYFKRVETGRSQSGEKSSYGVCTSEGQVSVAMSSLLLVINALAVVLANIQAYLTRNIKLDYNESKWIGLSMVSILQALLIGVPLVILASENPTANFIVQVMLVFVICTSILGLIFAPKFLRHYRDVCDAGGKVPKFLHLHHNCTSRAEGTEAITHMSEPTTVNVHAKINESESESVPQHAPSSEDQLNHSCTIESGLKKKESAKCGEE